MDTKMVNGVVVKMTPEDIKIREAEKVRDEKEAEEKAKVKYRDDRKMAYPEIGDQLDDLFRQGAFSKEMTAVLEQVKTNNPKPE